MAGEGLLQSASELVTIGGFGILVWQMITTKRATVTAARKAAAHALATVEELKHVAANVEEVRHATNSLTEQLVDKTQKAADAAGEKRGIEIGRVAAEKLAYDRDKKS